MRVLLDTKAWLWWLTDDPRLSAEARAVIGDASNDVFVSVVSVLEVFLKMHGRKIVFAHSPHRSMKKWLAADGIRMLPLEFEQVLTAMVLPWHHEDPIDRILIAQTRSRALAIVTDQKIFAQYDCDVIFAQGSR